MNPEELPRILSMEPEIIPSSGFTQSVMQAVRDEAQAPKLIPFPWIRAVPGIVACCVMVSFLAINLLGNPKLGLSFPVPTIMAVWHNGLNWLTLATTVSTCALLATRQLLAD